MTRNIRIYFKSLSRLLKFFFDFAVVILRQSRTKVNLSPNIFTWLPRVSCVFPLSTKKAESQVLIGTGSYLIVYSC